MGIYKEPEKLPYERRPRDKHVKSRRRTPVATGLMERRNRAWNYRVQGYSFSQIAEMVTEDMGENLGLDEYTDRHVRRDLDAALEHVNENLQMSVESVREIEAARLDQMITHLWSKVERGDTRAAKTVLDIMEMRAKLFGLHAARKVNMSINVRHEIEKMAAEHNLTPEEAAEAIAEAEKILAEANRGS